jgi:hypothetical protein
MRDQSTFGSWQAPCDGHSSRQPAAIHLSKPDNGSPADPPERHLTALRENGYDLGTSPDRGGLFVDAGA